MELGLTPIGQMISVGAAAIAAINYILYWLGAFHWLGLRELKLHAITLDTPKAILFLLASYTLGVLLDDTSKAFVAKRSEIIASSESASSVLGAWFSTDKELRLRSIFDISKDSANFNQCDNKEPTGCTLILRLDSSYEDLICYETDDDLQNDNRAKKITESIRDSLGISNDFCKKYTDTNENNHPQLKEWVTLENEGARDLIDNVNKLYYIAKNQIYREDNYFIELSPIYDRMNFTRALTFLSLCTSTLYLLVLGYSLFSGTLFFNMRSSKSRKHLITAIVVTSLATWAINAAFVRESDNFNRRVFGYYVSQAYESAKKVKIE